MSFLKNLIVVGGDRIRRVKDKGLDSGLEVLTKIEKEAKLIGQKRSQAYNEDSRVKQEQAEAAEDALNEIFRLEREQKKTVEDADIITRAEIESIIKRSGWADLREKYPDSIKSLNQRALLSQFIGRYEREFFPLHTAVWNNDYCLAKTLISFGFGLTLRNAGRKSVRDMAAGNIKMIALVEQAINDL